jgi:hypothetical protein
MPDIRTSKLMLGVDAGNISVVDAAITCAEAGRKEFLYSFKTIKVTQKGWYKVKLITSTHFGRRQRTRNIYTKESKFYIGDLCYMFSKNAWKDFLEKTECLQKENDHFFVVDTGGDGCFSVRAEFTFLGE